MKTRTAVVAHAAGALLLGMASAAPAHEIHAPPDKGLPAAWDVLHAKVTTDGRDVVFRMQPRAEAGKRKPRPTGKFAGSQVQAYVWPTSLDPAAVGFEQKAGILAFAVTAHPDFDDTPLFDENGDGKVNNDGAKWHSHWVVLEKDESCGQNALKVTNIPAGAKPRLPRTWPGVPLLLDSPGWSPVFDGQGVSVRVPFDDIGALQGASFDAVTVALRVNANLHAPLLCVSDVYKVVSGNLSLPGKVAPASAP